MLSIGTFNVRGLTNGKKQRDLDKDFQRYKLQILAIQETKHKEGAEIDFDSKNRLIMFEQSTSHRGVGFLISNSIINNVI